MTFCTELPLVQPEMCWILWHRAPVKGATTLWGPRAGPALCLGHYIYPHILLPACPPAAPHPYQCLSDPSTGCCRAPSAVSSTKGQVPLCELVRCCAKLPKVWAYIPAPAFVRQERLCPPFKCSSGIMKAPPCFQGNGCVDYRISLKEGALRSRKHRIHDSGHKAS